MFTSEDEMPKIGGFGAGAVNYEAATAEATAAATTSGAGATAEAGSATATTTPASGAEAGSAATARQPANGAESGAALRARTIVAQPPAGGAEASSSAGSTTSVGAAAEAASSGPANVVLSEGYAIASTLIREGDTGKARATADHLKKLMTTGVLDWKVTSCEIDKAVELLEALSPKEAMFAFVRLSGEKGGKLADQVFEHANGKAYGAIHAQAWKAIEAAAPGAPRDVQQAAYNHFASRCDFPTKAITH